MPTIGTVESLWRYPVKSMRGAEMPEVFMGFSGIYGDRCYAFGNSAAQKGCPYLTATAQRQMLRFSPQFRYAERAIKPPNLTEAMSIAPGLTPANAEPNDLILDVVTPSGAAALIAFTENSLYSAVPKRFPTGTVRNVAFFILPFLAVKFPARKNLKIFCKDFPSRATNGCKR
jgi:MOSC N-terminal beta barrel domain